MASQPRSVAPSAPSTLKRGRSRLALTLALGIGLFGLLTACSEEAKAQVSEAAQNVDTEAVKEQATEAAAQTDDGGSEQTETPATPAPSEGGGTDTTEEGLSDEDILLLVILGVAAIAIILIATAASSDHKQKTTAARSSLNSKLSEIVGGSRWIHDQGSLEILRLTDSAQLSSSWPSVRERMVDLESSIAVLSNAGIDARLSQSLDYLGQTMAGLRGALSSYTTIRTSPDAAGQAELIQSSVQTVYERRRQVQAAIEPIAAAHR